MNRILHSLLITALLSAAAHRPRVTFANPQTILVSEQKDPDQRPRCYSQAQVNYTERDLEKIIQKHEFYVQTLHDGLQKGAVMALKELEFQFMNPSFQEVKWDLRGKYLISSLINKTLLSLFLPIFDLHQMPLRLERKRF